MDTKSFKFHIFYGSIARPVFFRLIMLVSAVSIVSLLNAMSKYDLASLATFNDCIAISNLQVENVTLSPGSYLFQRRVLSTFWGSFDSMNCTKDANLTVNVINELMGKQILNYGAKSLCIGEGSSMAVMAMKKLGFSSVIGVQRHSFFSLMQKKIVYELDYKDGSFDFVVSRDLDKVSVSAMLVLEVERILKPGGIGALLIGSTGSNSNDLIRSATQVSSLLRSSSVVYVGYVDQLNLVVFKKRTQNESAFYQYSIPEDCPSLTFTKPLIELMEPLMSERPIPIPEYEKSVPYLPKFIDVSARKRLVYIDIGVGELLNANVSDWFMPSYPIDQKNFNVYFVHYNTSIMLSYVKRPGVMFVYYPGLAGKVDANLDHDSDEDMDPYVGEDEFDFLAWFKETVQYADFVVLKMNAGKIEVKFLKDVFESGAICFVDELFLRCPENGSVDDKTMNSKESCMDIYKGLRSNGVYVHQWWGN
ncbi:putative S-adenosyl-L-methionine-dependent methyltransferase [Lupinus albus]|uniref:Putative S-adenosyl-L-methionine-dependent methyltransferase n=1 Tax=Lupinus albus TaxID=3870 RepID=A0A6A4R938_LUPAL|nr:putative S-adenosyl-L-methionine-dependent methyltransferase [Lupinus albus]